MITLLPDSTAVYRILFAGGDDWLHNLQRLKTILCAQVKLLSCQCPCEEYNNHLGIVFLLRTFAIPWRLVARCCAAYAYFYVFRMVLSTCSPYMRSLFSSIPSSQHPIIFIKDIEVGKGNCLHDSYKALITHPLDRAESRKVAKSKSCFCTRKTCHFFLNT